MKHYLALFTATLLLVANCIVYTPIKAVGSSVDFGEMLLEYTNLAEIGLALTQGANIDWSGIEYPAGSENWTDQEKAQYVVNYFGSLRHAGLHAIYEYLFEGPNDNPYLQNTAAISFGNNTSFGTTGVQDLRTQLANALSTNNGAHIFQKYSDDVIARFNEYDAMYINRYLDTVNEDIDIPIVNPNPNYATQINKINGRDSTDYNAFWFYDFPQFITNPYSSSQRVQIVAYPFTNYTIIIPNTNVVNPFNPTGNNGNWYGYGQLHNIASLYITQNVNETYNLSFTSNPITNSILLLPNNEYYSWFNIKTDMGVKNYGVSSAASSTYTVNLVNQSLDSIFNYIIAHFKNVNIYVNGEAWSLPVAVIDNPAISVSIPDAVIDTSNEDGKIVAHPIYYPDAVTTDGSIDIDLDKVRDMIIDAIENGRTSVSVDDLVNAGAAVKVDGTTLTDADTASVDVSVPIEAAKTGELTIPIGSVPPLPGLPPIIPPGGFGDGNTENGFAGMSVLARIINVTIQSVPEPLIMTFFGVIFGMIVLGIIKILHH